MSNTENKESTPIISDKLKKLESLLEWFESDEVTVESALGKYEESLKLARDIEQSLQDAKSQIEVINKKFSDL